MHQVGLATVLKRVDFALIHWSDSSISSYEWDSVKVGPWESAEQQVSLR